MTKRVRVGDALAFLEANGMFVDRNASPHKRFHWDGKSLAGKCVTGRRHAANLLHELAHWKLTPPEYRSEINYGLGRSPDEWGSDQIYVAIPGTPRHAPGEEELASVLGAIYEAMLGGSPYGTTVEHSWGPYRNQQYLDKIHELENRNLLDTPQLTWAADQVIRMLMRYPSDPSPEIGY